MEADRTAAHVEFRGVSKTFDNRTMVLDHLNLRVEKGEFYTLLGTTGAGKTTCLNLLAGFDAPTFGSILIDGKSIVEMPARARGIGVVLQSQGLFPHMTVHQNLSFPLEVRGMSAAQRREPIQRILDTVRLRRVDEMRPHELTAVQRQKVAIARALVFGPLLVLMDEPLVGLERRERNTMQFEIRRIHEEVGVTVMYFTHDQQVAMAISSRVAVLHGGRIQQVDPPDALYNEPKHISVARYIGDSNVLHGHVVSIDDDICEINTPDGSVRARVAGRFRLGDPAAVAIRPERVTLATDRIHANRFKAKVQEVLFVGDHSTFRVELGGESRFIVQVPNVAGQTGARKGDTVDLGWDATDCTALPDDGE